MTPGEKCVLESLVAVAWADGAVQQPEESVIEGLLSGFDATPEEEAEIKAYAAQPRRLDDIPLDALGEEERELLLANACLLTHADGIQTAEEKALLDRLVDVLGFPPAEAAAILASARDGALRLGSRALVSDED